MYILYIPNIRRNLISIHYFIFCRKQTLIAKMGSNESNGSMRRSSEIIGDDTTKVHNLLFFSNFLFALKLFKGLALSLWSKLDQTCLILQIDFNFFLSCFGFWSSLNWSNWNYWCKLNSQRLFKLVKTEPNLWKLVTSLHLFLFVFSKFYFFPNLIRII